MQLSVTTATLSVLVAVVSSLPTPLDDGAVHDLTHPAKPIREALLRSTPWPVRFDLNKAALIIVDMQKGALKEAAEHAGLALVAPINKTLAAARAANVTVVWVQWGVRADYAEWIGEENAGWYTPPVAGTDDARIYPGLDVQPTDSHVNKHRESGFYQSQLNDLLRFQGRRTLFFAGINSDMCVYGTMLDASWLGYDTFMVDDLLATMSPKSTFAAYLSTGSRHRTTSHDLIAAFETASSSPGGSAL